MTVTSRPAPTSRSAADNPARPAPTTTTWSVGPGTVRRRGTAIGEPGSEPTGGGRHAELAEHDASLLGDRGHRQGGPGLVGALRDHALDVCEGAGLGDDLAQCRHAGGVQAGVAQVPAQHRGLSRVRALRLPSRRSSPAGLPVSAGSPKTPSTSSRSWKASPSGTPYAVKLASTSGPAPASTAPRCSGPSIVYLALLYRATRSARAIDGPPSTCSSRSRYWPAINSTRIWS